MSETSKREKSLSRSLTHVLEECRMVLPGIQALFGFQLIAVFNAATFGALRFVLPRLHWNESTPGGRSEMFDTNRSRGSRRTALDVQSQR